MTGREIHEAIVDINLAKEMLSDKLSQAFDGGIMLTREEAKKMLNICTAYAALIMQRDFK